MRARDVDLDKFLATRCNRMKAALAPSNGPEGIRQTVQEALEILRVPGGYVGGLFFFEHRRNEATLR